MSRLILVPQYPVPMRYQQWWFDELPRQYGWWFDQVIVLGAVAHKTGQQPHPHVDKSAFAYGPAHSIWFEYCQMQEYLALDLLRDDVLLLCDLSYPGVFATVLWHKRPPKAFAICHATALNKLDLFRDVRHSKYPAEQAMAKMFDGVFVATNYHANKLGWDNLHVVALPWPPRWHVPNLVRHKPLITVARAGLQKRTMHLERVARNAVNCTDIRLTPGINSWSEYYRELGTCKRLLSTAKEETFGYQIVDAVMAGCIPIAPNRYSYPELLPREYLYDNEYELVQVIQSQTSVPKLLCQEAMFQFYKNTATIMRGE